MFRHTVTATVAIATLFTIGLGCSSTAPPAVGQVPTGRGRCVGIAVLRESPLTTMLDSGSPGTYIDTVYRAFEDGTVECRRHVVDPLGRPMSQIISKNSSDKQVDRNWIAVGSRR